MQQDSKTGRMTTSFEELVYTNSIMVEAVVELLMDKGLLTREEVLAKVKILKKQAQINFQPLQ